MSDNDGSPEDEDTSWFDGTLAGWAELHRQTEVFAWGGAVIALGLAHAEVPKWVASAYLCTRFAKKGQEHESAFPDILTLLPAQESGDLWRKSLNEILRLMRAQDADEFSLRIAPLLFECRSLVTFQTEDLLERLSGVPEGSCCFVPACELYRSSKHAAEHVEQGRVFLEDIVKAELERFMDALLEVARGRRLTIIATCEYWRVRRSAFWVTFHEREHFLGGLFVPVVGSVSREILEASRAAFDTSAWPGVAALAGEVGLPSDLLAAKLIEAYIDSDDSKCAAVFMAHPAAREHLLPEHLVAAARLSSTHVVSGKRELLEAALAHPQALPLEALAIGYHTAQAAALEDLETRFRERLLQRFPRNRVAEAINWNWLFRRRRFDETVPIAQRLNDPILMAQSIAFSSETLRADAFIAEAAKAHDREGALVECAAEALLRGGYRHAISWCREVASAHPKYFRAYSLRIEALSRALARCHKGIYLDEFTALCRIAAQRPEQPAFREKIFWLIEHGMEEPSAKILLSAVLMHAVQSQSAHDAATIAASRTLNDELEGKMKALDGEKFGAALQQYLDSLAGREIHIGLGDLPELFAKELGTEAILAIRHALDEPGVKSDPLMCRYVLHLLVLLCVRHGDPSADLSCLRSIAALRCVSGDAQEARDLAETGLQRWSQTQPQFVGWRTCLSWLVYGDVFHRSGNLLSAGACAYLALLALDGPGYEVESLLELYRLCARVLRDIDMSPALHVVGAIERRLLEQVPHNKAALHRHRVFFYQASVRDQLRSGTNAELLDLLRTGDDLLQVGIETETAPILSMQANLIRHLGEAALPLDLAERFHSRIASLPEGFRRFLEGAARAEVTREELVAAIEALSEARFAEDLGFQISPILPLVCNGLATACAKNDPELFLLASSLLSQPALAASLVGKAGIDTADAFSFQPLTQLGLAQLQACLRDGESALILTGEPGGPLYRMLVTKSTVSAPSLVPEAEWSRGAFYEWRRNYFRRFDWLLPRNILDAIQPPASDVLKFMADLRVELHPLPEELVVIPATHLFGFSFNLARCGEGFLGDATSVSVAPSAFWLVHRRTHAWSGSDKRKAWIGSRHTDDYTLHVLRGRVERVLEEHHFETDRSDEPLGFEDSQLALLGAHGGTGFFQYFRGVGDRVVHFSPANFAALLANTGCAILAICSSGKSDAQHGSEEALGLTAALLRAGVRCVIAPPWPMDVDVMDRWLPAFLEAAEDGATMSAAAQRARTSVAATFDHPLPKLQLHVYGDGAYRVR